MWAGYKSVGDASWKEVRLYVVISFPDTSEGTCSAFLIAFSASETHAGVILPVHWQLRPCILQVLFF